MAIDNLFDSKRDCLNAAKKPFDFIFFVDDINSCYNRINSLEDCAELLSDITYMQMYSHGVNIDDGVVFPMQLDPVRLMYGGAGAANIVYPFNDIVDYCAMRATADSIGNVWRTIDDCYFKDQSVTRRKMQKDLYVTPLSRDSHFMSTVNHLFFEEDRRFRFMYPALYEEDNDGTMIDRCSKYLIKISEHIAETTVNDTVLSRLKNDCELTKEELKRDNIVDKVVFTEKVLKEYYSAVLDCTPVNNNAVINMIIPDELTEDNDMLNNLSILNLLKLNNKIVHPLAVRMLLYKLALLIEKSLSDDKMHISSMRTKIINYFKKGYDDPKTPDLVESAEERAYVSGIFKRRRFAQEYSDKSSYIERIIEELAVDLMINSVLEKVSIRLKELISQYERLFDDLYLIIGKLGSSIDNIECYHDYSRTNIYAYSSFVEKRCLYDSLTFTAHEDNDDSFNEAVFRMLYENCIEKMKFKNRGSDRKAQTREKNLNSEKMHSMFFKSIVEKNKKDLLNECSNVLDITVFDALMKDTGNNLRKIKDRYITQALLKGSPYLIYDYSRLSFPFDADDAHMIRRPVFQTTWGISSEVSDEIANASGDRSMISFFNMYPTHGRPEIMVSDRYSKYEISCCEALYCIGLSDIPKFRDVGEQVGTYYKSYRKCLDEIEKSGSDILTPHLDKRWNQEGALPKLCDENDQDD